MDVILIPASFALGLCIGSFVGVLLDRIPRKESVVTTPSHCTNCGHKIKWYENIPLLSYIFLKGKCSQCGAKIPFKYFLIELLFGFIGVAVYLLIR